MVFYPEEFKHELDVINSIEKNKESVSEAVKKIVNHSESKEKGLESIILMDIMAIINQKQKYTKEEVDNVFQYQMFLADEKYKQEEFDNAYSNVMERLKND